MAYEFQRFIFEQVLKSLQVNQLESSIRDHIHGVDEDVNGLSGLRLLATATVSVVATVDFITGIDTTFKSYLLVGYNIIPATNNTGLRFRISDDDGVSFDAGASDYRYGTRGFAEDETAHTSQSDGGKTHINLSTSSGGLGNADSSEVYHFILWFYPGKNSSTYYPFGFFTAVGKLQSALVHAVYGGGQRTTAAGDDVDGFRLIMNSGSISGEFRLYGLDS